MRRGLYRIRGVNGAPADVRVDDDGLEFPVEEGLYQKRGYRPPLDELPWQENYLAAQPVDDEDATAAKAKNFRERARQEFRIDIPVKKKAPVPSNRYNTANGAVSAAASPARQVPAKSEPVAEPRASAATAPGEPDTIGFDE